MDYGRTELADRLAAEYVAGTLRGPARRRLEALLPAHPLLRQAVREWRDRLMPLTAGIEPATPSATVWPRIEARLGGSTSSTAAADRTRTATSTPGPADGSLRSMTGWWNRLVVWRGATALTGIAALALAVGLATPGPARPPLVVVLSPATPPVGSGPVGDSGVGGVATTAFVASVSADGRAMVTRPLHEAPGPAGHSLELWSLRPNGAAPRSLGVIAADRATVVERGRVLDGTTGFAVSLEPPGGSPSGAPTGPVLYVGKLAT